MSQSLKLDGIIRTGQNIGQDSILIRDINNIKC